MAKAQSKLKSGTCKEPPTPTITERFYTIGYVPSGFFYPQPKTTLLTIKGRWLEQLGFYAGQAIMVKIERNKLIIELAMQL